MELPSNVDTSQHDKRKMILMQPKITNISELSSTNYNKTIEVVVYRKWTSKTTKTRTPTKFCCILIEKQGTPIQANMGLRDAEYFDQLLQLRKAYRFFGFSCEPTDNWERTLLTQTSLIFGRFLQVEEIPNTDFPEHYFNFVAYNELPDRATTRNPILTGDAMTAQKSRRVIDIENLRYPQLPNIGPTLDIMNERYEDMEKEKMRNRFPFAVLREVDPQNYQKPPSTLSVRKGVGTIKNARHVDKNS
ncbi:DNA helicase [Tanacetum coccineum]